MEMVIGILFLLLAVSGMAIGIIFGNKPLSGSCGGLNPEGICSYCGGDPQKCENTEQDSIIV
tara:strand:- start:1957 stop:2142 length:186 start_codon:yes stop_codon:yes gene_type:complete